jgi:hypothetical protein
VRWRYAVWKKPKRFRFGRDNKIGITSINGDTDMQTLNEYLEAISLLLAILVSLKELGWTHAASARLSSILHGSLAFARAAIGGGLTLLPHMWTCWVLVKGLPSAPWLMM